MQNQDIKQLAGLPYTLTFHNILGWIPARQRYAINRQAGLTYTCISPGVYCTRYQTLLLQSHTVTMSIFGRLAFSLSLKLYNNLI